MAINTKPEPSSNNGWLSKEAYEKAKKAVEAWPDWKTEAYNQTIDRKDALIALGKSY